MKRLIKFLFPFCILLPCFFLVPASLNWGSSLLIKETSIYGTTYFRVDVYNWFVNYSSSFGSFENLAYRFSSLTLNFSGVVNPFISIANCIIAVVNTLFLPISLISCLLTVLMAFVGFPLTNQNFIYSALNTGSMLQIPYINYV